MDVPGYPNMTREQYFAPWRYAGQRPFNPAIDGMSVKAGVILGAIAGLAAGLLMAFVAYASAQSAAELYGDPPGWREKLAQCPCIRNIDGVCMTFGKGPYPYRTRDAAIESPHCVTGCYPDFNDVYGFTRAIKQELAECQIDWQRIQREKCECPSGAPNGQCWSCQ